MKRYNSSYKIHHSDGFSPSYTTGHMKEDTEGRYIEYEDHQIDYNRLMNETINLMWALSDKRQEVEQLQNLNKEMIETLRLIHYETCFPDHDVEPRDQILKFRIIITNILNKLQEEN